MKTAFRLLLLCAAALLVAATASAQGARVGKDWYTDKHNGYRFRYPAEWKITPVRPEEKSRGILTQMEGPGLATKIEGNKVATVSCFLQVFRFDPREAVTGEEEPDGEQGEGGGSTGLRGRVQSGKPRTTVDDVIEALVAMREPQVAGEETKKIKSFTDVLHKSFKGHTGDYSLFIDTWTIHLPDYDIALLFYVPEQHLDKWEKVFVDCVKTFELIGKEEATTVTDETDYESVLKATVDETSRTPGWRVVETPSRRYIIVTSSKDDEFIEQITSRLENARDLYEKDFPPSKPIQHISRVRVCASLDEFHVYGKTGGGVAGWFNPGTTELVIVDFKDYDRNMTYGVITHEAFHQYCHFLFDESEAHRWFDEGHGDYYGGFEFKGKKATPTPKMAGGLDRLSVIREMLRTDDYVPIAKHVRLNHPEWQNHGVKSYSQSWSIIWFLRMGMLGKAPAKLWKDEYADIVPNYVRTLHQGFLKAYEEIRGEIEAKVNEGGGKISEEELESLKINRFALDDEHKQKIWDDAIAASWGQIDLEEFEENWKEFALKHIK